jgi:hypothetical protein
MTRSVESVGQGGGGEELTHSSSVGSATQSVPPNIQQLTMNTAAMRTPAVINIRLLCAGVGPSGTEVDPYEEPLLDAGDNKGIRAHCSSVMSTVARLYSDVLLTATGELA